MMEREASLKMIWQSLIEGCFAAKRGTMNNLLLMHPLLIVSDFTLTFAVFFHACSILWWPFNSLSKLKSYENSAIAMKQLVVLRSIGVTVML